MLSKIVPIGDIQVGERARADLGDLAELSKSIGDFGLLQPAVVTADLRLIAGHRRLESCRALGMTEMPVIVAEHITDAVDLLKAERDENTCRKPMTASELIALGRQIEELERPEGARRQGTRTDLGRELPVRPNEKFDSREKAAEAVGLSSATYTRIKQVANAVEGYKETRGQRTEVSPERQVESREALELMDRITAGEEVRPAEGGRPLTVTAVYEKWDGKKVNRGDQAPAERRRTVAITPATAAPLTDVRGRRMPQRSQHQSITDGIAALTGLCIGISGIKRIDESIDAEEAALWKRDLDHVLRVLRSFNAQLKEHIDANR